MPDKKPLTSSEKTRLKRLANQTIKKTTSPADAKEITDAKKWYARYMKNTSYPNKVQFKGRSPLSMNKQTWSKPKKAK